MIYIFKSFLLITKKSIKVACRIVTQILTKKKAFRFENQPKKAIIFFLKNMP